MTLEWQGAWQAVIHHPLFGIGITLGVEGEVAGGDLQRGGGFVEARGEGLPAEISGDPNRTDGSSSRIVISGGQVELCLGCGSIARVSRPVD